MAVIIDTASKVVDKFATDVHGFDHGDPQAGLAPTELSDDWCDGVQQEINNAIDAGPVVGGLDNANRLQLAESIEAQIVTRYPRGGGAAIYTWRGHSANTGGSDYLRRERSAYNNGVANNTVQNLLGMTLPNNSQATMVMRGSIVQTDSMTVYGNVINFASVRNSAGVYTLQSSSNVSQDISLGGLIIVPIVIGAAFYLRFTIPVVVGKVFNIFATGCIENVTQ